MFKNQSFNMLLKQQPCENCELWYVSKHNFCSDIKVKPQSIGAMRFTLKKRFFYFLLIGCTFPYERMWWFCKINIQKREHWDKWEKSRSCRVYLLVGCALYSQFQFGNGVLTSKWYIMFLFMKCHKYVIYVLFKWT